MEKGTQKVLITWIAGGAGVVLLYAALKNKSPKDIVINTLTKSGGIYGTGITPAINQPVNNLIEIPPLPDSGSITVLDRHGYSRQVPDAYKGSPHSYIPVESYVV